MTGSESTSLVPSLASEVSDRKLQKQRPGEIVNDVLAVLE